MLAQGAARAGDRARAYQLYCQVLAREPRNEAAWWGRYNTAPDSTEACLCLYALLEINPHHPLARQAVEGSLVRSA